MVFIATKEERLKELVEKGKKAPLSNAEMMEMISILGPDKAMEAIRNNNK